MKIYIIKHPLITALIHPKLTELRILTEFIISLSKNKNRITKKEKKRRIQLLTNIERREDLNKMNKKKRQDSSEFSSEDSKNSSDPSTLPATGDDEGTVNAQKRKGTIWKILFPEKKNEKQGTELERLVCRQVEHQISKDPKVKKSYADLENFENSEEGQSMTRSEFTKKKNRISAQLSRERREAILHSLIKVCLDNINAKKELDNDIEEVKKVVKSTICEDCSDKFKNLACPNKHPSTLSKKSAGSKSPKPIKNVPAMTVSRSGAYSILFAFATMACIAMVAFGPQLAQLGGQNTNNFITTHQPDTYTAFEARHLSEMEDENSVSPYIPSSGIQKRRSEML